MKQGLYFESVVLFVSFLFRGVKIPNMSSATLLLLSIVAAHSCTEVILFGNVLQHK